MKRLRDRTSRRGTRVEIAWYPTTSSLISPDGFFLSSQLSSSTMGCVFPSRGTAAATSGLPYSCRQPRRLRGGWAPSRLARRSIHPRLPPPRPFHRAFPSLSPLGPLARARRGRGCLTSLLRFSTGAMAPPQSPADPAVPGPLRALPTPPHEPKASAGAEGPLPPGPAPQPSFKMGLKSFDWGFFFWCSRVMSGEGRGRIPSTAYPRRLGRP